MIERNREKTKHQLDRKLPRSWIEPTRTGWRIKSETLIKLDSGSNMVSKTIGDDQCSEMRLSW